MSSKASKVKGFLSKGFKPDKCKTSIKMAESRMKVMRNKRDVQVKKVRREVAQLLQSGDDSTARIRVDHVIRDEKTISAYELLEVYCELIIQRLHIIDSQKICPIDLKEAIATVVFAAPRCADVPEMSDVSKHFQAKYGKEFMTAALELRPGSGVSTLVVEKLAGSSANIETKVKVLKAIAQENNVKWEAKGFEEEKTVPQLGRLDGSSKFLKVSETVTVQPVTVQTPPPVTTYQPQNYVPQNSVADQPARLNNSFGHISDPPVAAPVQVIRSQSGSRNKENTRVSKEDSKKTPPHLPDYEAEYTTIEEATEAAAKSAEIASRAAIAAAYMARHGSGSLSREQSNVSSKSYSRRDSPRKHDMEEVSSRPETFGVASQTSSPLHARGPQASPFKSVPDRSPVAPPSPSPSQSSASSNNYSEPYEETPSPAAQRSPEYFKESSRWDDNEDEEEPEVINSNLKFVSSGVAFDDSRHEKYDRPLYKEESIYQFERNNSSSSKGGTSLLFSDNSNPQLPKSGSVRKNSSSHLFSSNSNEWDPPRSPANHTKFDNGPKSASSGSLINNDSPNLLSVLSGRNPPQSYSEEDSIPKFDSGPDLLSVLNGRDPPQSYNEEGAIPKFDSGPNFDSNEFFDDESDEGNLVPVHVEEEKVVEEEYIMESSMSPVSHAKEGTKNTVTPSSDETRSKKYPQSFRTRDSRTNHRETSQHKITKEPRAKAERTSLPYTQKESSSDDDDDLGNQQFLDYGTLTGGHRNRSGPIQPSYTVKPLAEKPEPSTPHAIRKTVVDLSAEEERLYNSNRSNNVESEVGKNRHLRDTTLENKPSERKDAGRSAVRYTPNRRNFDKDEEEQETDEEIAQPPKIKLFPSSWMSSVSVAMDDDKLAQPPKLKKPSSSSESKGYLGVSENQFDYQEPLEVNRKLVGRGGRDPIKVTMDEFPTERTKKEVPSKIVQSRGPARHVPAWQDSYEEEQVRTEPPKESTKERNRKEAPPRGPARHVPAWEESDEEEQVRTAPPKESTKERNRKEAPSRGPARHVPSWEDSDEEEPARITPLKESTKERPRKEAPRQGPVGHAPAWEDPYDEDQVRTAPPKESNKERMRKEAPSRVPFRYVSAREDPYEEEQVRTVPPKKSNKDITRKEGPSRGPARYASAQKDSDEEEEARIVRPNGSKRSIRKEAPSTTESRAPSWYVPEDSDEEEQARTVPPKASTKSSPVDGSKDKVDLMEKKEEKESAVPTFTPLSFPLDMDALKARVQMIKANMNNP